MALFVLLQRPHWLAKKVEIENDSFACIPRPSLIEADGSTAIDPSVPQTSHNRSDAPIVDASKGRGPRVQYAASFAVVTFASPTGPGREAPHSA
jgi:hypothetical protein